MLIDSSDQKVVFIAEVSSNHNKDLERCYRFIDAAAAIGCDAVKFQLFRIEELFSPEVLTVVEEAQRRSEWELPVSFLPELSLRCREKGVKFSCTPFYLEAVEELLSHVDFFKIASYELLWSDLLIACAKTGKPVVLSTGMANMAEVQEAVNTLINAGCRDLTLLHCVSSYPVPADECNLAAIETISKKFNLPVGWSDHSVSPAVINRAIHRWGASMVEFHLDLEGEGEEFAAGHCWLPNQMADLIREIRLGIQADGSGSKEPVPSELPDRDWRADPTDGLRPLKNVRDTFQK
jgi:sialic acid synthase SpsE